ncbi:MAG TPA: sigma 54-interacting transcriptional regulator [Pyrinomonadaceae bacterium]|nr:sigma 54-interacting transcriptional regulator [Pyrinomonadaceae bacterium]
MLVVDDETNVREQLTRPQSSSPTGRVAAFQSDIELVRRSQAFIDVFKQVDRVSTSDSPVLLVGDSATVKELVASAIHHFSNRRDQPFVAVNCAELIEPESFAQADGGTIFVDEITKADSSFQETLLRALQSGEVGHVSSGETRRAGVRVIAGVNHSVEQDVAAGKIRTDLFYRLNAATIVLPPLRDEPQKSEPVVNEEWVTLSEIEGRYVARVLEHTRGNKQAAARVLCVDRKTLDRMIKRHHIVSQYTRGQRAKVVRSV